MPLKGKLTRLLPTRTYPDWDTALQRCGSGYDNEVIASVVAEKTARLRSVPLFDRSPSSASLLSAASFAGRSRPFRVIDVGGAAGAHYLEFQALVPADSQTQWVVVETAAMVNAARTLTLPQNLQHVQSLSQASQILQGSPHVLMASGVLMYLPDPIAALEQMTATGAERLIFTRTGLSPDGHTRIIVQKSRLSDNGPGSLPPNIRDRNVRYPNTFIPRHTFDEIVGSKYELRLAALTTPRAWRAGRVSIDQYTYVADRRA